MIPFDTQRIDLRLFDASQPGAEAGDAETPAPQGADEAPADKARAFRALIRGEYREQYAEETQRLINKRFRETEALRQRLGDLERAAASAAERLGLDPDDPAALLRALEGAEGPLSHGAARRDSSPRGGAEAAGAAEEEAVDADAHAFALDRSAYWAANAEALAAAHPDFDLAAMCADPTFTLLLTHGAPMERAWQAATVDARVAEAAARAEKAVADNIRARGMRPAEAGGGVARPALRPDVAALSDDEVRGVLERLERRERVSFG